MELPFTTAVPIVEPKQTQMKRLYQQTLLFCLLALGAGVNRAQAQIELLYWWQANNATTTFPRTAVSNVGGISGLQNYSGLSPLADNRSGWYNPNRSTTLNPATAPYVSIKYVSNQTVKLDRFVLGGFAVPSIYTTRLELRWSVDNFASSLGNFTYSGSGYSLTSVVLNSVQPAGTIEFRIYAYNGNLVPYNGGQLTSYFYLGQGSTLNTSSDGTPLSFGVYGHAIAIWGSFLCSNSSSVTNQTITASQLPYTWNGLTFTAAGSQTAHLTNSCGMDSAATLNLAVNTPGEAIRFDGVNDVAMRPANTDFDLAQVTVQAWVKRDALNGQNVCILGSRAFANTRFSVHMNNSAIGLWNNSSYQTVNCGNFVAGTWYHVTMVIKASSADVYLNGVYKGSTGNGMGTRTGLPLIIGAANPDGSGLEQFNGSLDEVRIWNRPLSACEIRNTYACSFSSPQSGLIAQYKADQGTAFGDNTAITQLQDFSGFNRPATLVNMVRTGSTSNFGAPGAVSAGVCALPASTASTSSITVCNTQLPYTWNGQSYGATGTYVVTLSNAAGCDSVATLNLTVNNCNRASVFYYGSPYCASSGNLSPSFTPVANGVFTGDAGLSINTATGVIDLGASTNGHHSITYGAPGNQATAAIDIRPTSVIDQPSNYVYCAEGAGSAVNFQPMSGITTTWTNDNPSIGLASSGQGYVPPFLCTNNSSVPIFGTITVRPAGGTGCTFSPLSFRITIKPTPRSLTTPPSQTVCAGSATAPVTFLANISGSSFVWSNSKPAIGIAANGSGDLPSFTATNNTGAALTATMAGVPVLNGCAGPPAIFFITVHPSAQAISYPSGSYCQAGTVAATRVGSSGGAFSATPVGLSLNTATGEVKLGASLPTTYTITYAVPASGGCAASASTTLQVLAQSGVNPVANQVVCPGALVPSMAWIGPDVPFNWTNDNPSIGLPASGTGDLPAFTAVNTDATARSAFIRVSAQATAGSTLCPSKPMVFRITVNAPNTGGCGPVAQPAPGGGAGTGRIRLRITVNPNPTVGITTVTLSESGTYTIQVVDRMGAPAGSPHTFTGSRTSLDLSGLTPGSYLLRVVNNRSGEEVQQQVIRL